jgi:hypothetical protein
VIIQARDGIVSERVLKIGGGLISFYYGYPFFGLSA